MIQLKVPRCDPVTLMTQVGWLNDPENVRHSEQRHKNHTIATQWTYIRSFDPTDNILREIHSNGTMAGTITAYVDRRNRVADMGLLIGKEHWGKSIGYEAWRMLGDELLDDHNMRRIEAGCMSKNIGMISIMKKYGMKEEGRRIAHFFVDNGYSDLVLYGRFR